MTLPRIQRIHDLRPQNLITPARAIHALSLIEAEKNWARGVFYTHPNGKIIEAVDQCKIDTGSCSFCFAGAFVQAVFCPLEGREPVTVSKVTPEEQTKCYMYRFSNPEEVLSPYWDREFVLVDVFCQLQALINFDYNLNDNAWKHSDALAAARLMIERVSA